MSKLSWLRHYIPLGLTFSLGVILSGVAAMATERWQTSHNLTRFQRQLENLTTALQRSLNRYTDVLASLSDYYLVSNLQVERQEFAIFVQRSLRDYPGIQALEWAPVVPVSKRLNYERRMRRKGHQNFKITELSGPNLLVSAKTRSHYIPVTYLEPLTGNEQALGYDLNSHPIRAAAIQKATQTGKIAAPGRIQLVQEKRNQFGFLVFLPLYQLTPIKKSTSSPEKNLAGFLLGVFRVSDVVEEALRDLRYEIDFILYDRTAISQEQFLGFYEANRKRVTTFEQRGRGSPTHSLLCAIEADCIRKLTVGQREWVAIFSPAPNSSTATHYNPFATLLTGLLLTSSLVLFLHTLSRKLQKTKELSELKLRFFSMASHELRTPLSTILLSADSLLINSAELSASQKQKNLQRIQQAARRMSQQLSDILMLTRAEVGKLEFSPELFDLEGFCQQIVEEMQVSVPQTILYTSQSETQRAYLDKKLIRSLLTNLLSNASKYSAHDLPIQLILTCTPQGATFQICDQGIGISPEEQPYICETFYRGSNIGDITGTGLGLAIVKTCVNLHQGQLKIESQIGKGTQITIKLPFE